MCGKSSTFTPLIVNRISPTLINNHHYDDYGDDDNDDADDHDHDHDGDLSPEDMAGVPCSIAETTTGREPWIRNPNSPPTLESDLESLYETEEKNIQETWIQNPK